MTVTWLTAATLAMAGLLAFASPAAAQGRDAGDRGLRLDHDELRSDIRQDRLKRPTTGAFPVVPVSPPQEPQAKPRKSKRPGGNKTP